MSYYQQNVDELEDFVHSHVNTNVYSLVTGDHGRITPEYLEEFENLYDGNRPKDVFEYWSVSRYLFEKLRSRGAPVADLGSCYVWGRTTTGQGIALDWVIMDIHRENHNPDISSIHA